MTNIRSVKSCLVAVATISFVGCVSHDYSWTPVAGAGPYLHEGVRAPAFQRCEQRLMDGAAQCEVAFEDSAGRKIEVFKTLVPQLDAQLQSLPEFKTWPRSKGLPAQAKIPFKLYLLTISPAIVVMVPSPPAQIEKCWNDAPEGTCLRSYVAFGSGYDLGAEFPVVEGSSWFVLGKDAGARALPAVGEEYVFPLEAVNAKLVRVGSSWRFSRAK